jgi:hypothetical protein
MPLMYGRRSALFTARTMRSAIVMARHIDPLGKPPASSNRYVDAVEAAVGGIDRWGMLGNDRYGDCVFADDGHVLMQITANTGSIVVPTAADCLANYAAETGFDPNDPSTDEGADETTDCEFMISAGLVGHKADVTGMVDPRNIDHVKWCVQLFGACRLGVRWTQEAMSQFNAGQPITDWSGTVDGGHDVPIVHYEGDTPYIVTWSQRVPTTWEWVAHAAEEAHVLLYLDWVRRQGLSPAGFDLTVLEADIKNVA